jgi:hypothetical protein
MRAYINGKHGKSGEPLYSLLEISAASELPIYTGEKDADVIFNWGGAFKTASRAKVVLNDHPLFGKLAQAKAMLKAGVATPPAYSALREVRAFPVLGKLNDSHGGKGIRLISSARGKIGKADWFQGYINKQAEFRVYFFNGVTTIISEKIVKDKNKVIWNIVNCTGWERRRDLENNKELTSLVAEAAKAVRLDWGAADVLQDKSGKFWICEVNSRPSCWNRARPKLKMTKDKNGIYRLEGHEREELTLSARMWGNQMKKYIRKLEENGGERPTPDQTAPKSRRNQVEPVRRAPRKTQPKKETANDQQKDVELFRRLKNRVRAKRNKAAARY